MLDGRVGGTTDRTYRPETPARNTAANNTDRSSEPNSSANGDTERLRNPAEVFASRTGITGQNRLDFLRRLPDEDRRAVVEADESNRREVEVRAAVDLVNEAANTCLGGSPERAATVLEEQARALNDPAQVNALLNQLEPTLTSVADQVAADKENEGQTRAVLGAFTRVAEMSGDSGVQTLARATAHNFPDGDLEDLDNAVEDSIKAGEGTRFAAALVNELNSVGKLDGANDVASAAASGINDLREEFAEAADRVDELNQELAYYTANFGSLLTDEQLEAGTQAFLDKHAEEYARFEEAGRNLSSALDGFEDILDPNGSIMQRDSDEMRDLVEAAQNGLRELPRLLNTEAGTEACLDALEAQGQGQRTFLDSVVDLAADSPDLLESVGVGVIRAVGRAAVSDVNRRNLDRVLDGFERNARLFGIEPDALHDITRDLRNLATAEKSKRIRRLTTRLNETLNETGVFSADTRSGQAFRGLALVLGSASAINRASDWGQLTATERAQVLVDGLEAGTGAFEFAASTLGKGARAASLAGRASVVLGVLSSGLDLYAGAQAIGDGRYLQGTASLATGAGGLLLAAGLASQSVPVAGTIIGGVLLVGGFGLSLLAGSREDNKHEGPVEEFLRDAGLSDKLAEELSNHDGDGRPAGPVLLGLAERIGVTPQELVAYLDTLEEDEVQSIIEAAHGVDPDDEGVYQATGDDAEAIRDASLEELVFGVRPESIEGLALYLERFGYLPPGAHV